MATPWPSGDSRSTAERPERVVQRTHIAVRHRPREPVSPRTRSAGRLPAVGWGAGWVITGVGVAVVLAALRDIFHTLWHPSGRGGLGRKFLGAVWRAGRPRHGHRRVRVLAGPLAMVVVVMAWVVLIVLGWTLIYWPHLAGDRRDGAPDRFGSPLAVREAGV
jgi:hypothetical protein